MTLIRIPPEDPAQVIERDMGKRFIRFGKERIGSRLRPSLSKALLQHEAGIEGRSAPVYPTEPDHDSTYYDPF
jgi:hypothetical protein